MFKAIIFTDTLALSLRVKLKLNTVVQRQTMYCSKSFTKRYTEAETSKAMMLAKTPNAQFLVPTIPI